MPTLQRSRTVRRDLNSSGVLDEPTTLVVQPSPVVEALSVAASPTTSEQGNLEDVPLLSRPSPPLSALERLMASRGQGEAEETAAPQLAESARGRRDRRAEADNATARLRESVTRMFAEDRSVGESPAEEASPDPSEGQLEIAFPRLTGHRDFVRESEAAHAYRPQVARFPTQLGVPSTHPASLSRARSFSRHCSPPAAPSPRSDSSVPTLTADASLDSEVSRWFADRPAIAEQFMRDCPVYRPGLELFVLRRAHAEYPIGGVVAQTLGAEIRQRAQALDSFRESEARFLRGDQEAEETRWKEEDYMG